MSTTQLMMMFSSSNTKHISGSASAPPVDPIQALVDEYVAAVEAISGGAVEDETAVYNAINADVTAGLVTNTGVNTKLVLRVGYEFGLVMVGGKIDELVSLYKIGGVYPKFKAIASDQRGELQADHIKLNWNAPNIAWFDTANFDADYGKNSFFLEYTGHVYYVGTAIYFITNDPASTSFRTATLSSQRAIVVTFNENATSVSVNSNNNFWIDEFATYRFEYIRSGDTTSIKLYRNGTEFQTLVDRTWDKSLVFSSIAKRRFVGATDAQTILKLQEHKMGLL